MAVLYKDERIVCDDDGITVRMYYFPVGDKRITYDEIRSFDQRRLGPFTGRYRIWGTGGDVRFWYHLDPKRPNKVKAVVIDRGLFVKSVLTPDDPEAVLNILEDKVRRRV